MSNLRDRLKKISAERKPETEKSVPQRAQCAFRTRIVDTPPSMRLDSGTLQLLGGDAFRDCTLNPEDWIFIDTETTGLSRGVGTIAFEIGIGQIVGRQMKITQLWMRDYDQEEDMLWRLCSLFEGKKAIVSFNGKSYDLPLLLSRCTLNRIRAPWTSLPHLDLLHPARRLYKLRLNQCSLSHLEETVLDIHRSGDIPGSEIPTIWAEYLKTHNEQLLMDVFDHNLQDVQSMAYLLRKLYDAHQRPVEQSHAEDLFSIGRIYDHAQRFDVAKQCYERCCTINAASSRILAGKALTRIYRREHLHSELIQHLEQMIATGSGGIFPYVELAKLYEHRLGDPTRALYYTDLALGRTMNPNELQELTHRRIRLASKCKRKA